LDRTISERELCDYYDLPETTFEGVDFNLFMFYLDANWELFHMVSSEHVLNALEDYRAIPDEEKTYEGIEAIKEAGYGRQVSDYRYEYLVKNVCDKTLADENLDNLLVIMYANDNEIADVWVLDFSRELTFVSNDIRGIYNAETATGLADENMKNDVIGRLRLMENSEWWQNGETTWGSDQNTEICDGIGPVWIMYFKFDNGDVIKLSGKGSEGSYEDIPEDLAEFSHYVRLLAEHTDQ